MPGFTRSITVDRDLDTTWDFFLDHERMRSWMPDLVSIEKLTPGAVRFGTRYLETRRLAGSEHTAEREVSDFSARRRYATSVEIRGVTGTYEYRFRSVGDAATRIEFEARVTAGGFMKFALPRVVSALEAHDGDQLERFERALESAT